MTPAPAPAPIRVAPDPVAPAAPVPAPVVAAPAPAPAPVSAAPAPERWDWKVVPVPTVTIPDWKAMPEGGGDFLVQSAHKAAEKVACEQLGAWLAEQSKDGWSFATKLRAHIVGEASAHGPAPVYEPLLFVFRKPAP